MYSVVLMMALSGGGNAATADAALVNPVARYGDNGHKQERLFGGRRHGCHGGGGYAGCCGGGGYGAYGSYGYGGGYYGAMPYATGYYSSMPYSSGFYGTPTYGTPSYSGFQPAGPGYDYGTRANPNNNTEPLGPPTAGGSANAAAPATLVVRVPADAQLTIQGAPTISKQGVRTFTSPPLQPGKEYQYTIKAQVKRNGKTVERSRDVTVRAGQESDVTIDLPGRGNAPPSPEQSPSSK